LNLGFRREQISMTTVILFGATGKTGLALSKLIIFPKNFTKRV